MSLLLSTLLSETFQAYVPYFILIFLIHSSTIIWFISHISVYLLFISLCLCHYRLCLVLFHIFSHTATFDLSISLCIYITCLFYSLPIFLCSKIPLAIFLTLVSLLYVKLVLCVVPPFHYFFTVTNIPSFCSVVYLSSFSVHASFELPTAVLPESQIFWEVNIA